MPSHCQATLPSASSAPLRQASKMRANLVTAANENPLTLTQGAHRLLARGLGARGPRDHCDLMLLSPASGIPRPLVVVAVSLPWLLSQIERREDVGSSSVRRSRWRWEVEHPARLHHRPSLRPASICYQSCEAKILDVVAAQSQHVAVRLLPRQSVLAIPCHIRILLPATVSL